VNIITAAVYSSNVPTIYKEKTRNIHKHRDDAKKTIKTSVLILKYNYVTYKVLEDTTHHRRRVISQNGSTRRIHETPIKNKEKLKRVADVLLLSILRTWWYKKNKPKNSENHRH